MSVLYGVYAADSTSASDYISICASAVGDTLFLYEHLIRNKIVPERWFTFDELSMVFGSASGRYTIYRRKPKKQIVMSLFPIKGYASKPKKMITDWAIMEPARLVIEPPARPTPAPVRESEIYRNMIRELGQYAENMRDVTAQPPPIPAEPPIGEDNIDRAIPDLRRIWGRPI